MNIKTMNAVCVASFLLTNSLASVAQATTFAPETLTPINFYQRNCTPDDIVIFAESKPQTTTCRWNPLDDKGMQVTLHLNPEAKEGQHPAKIATGSCVFTPAERSQGTPVAKLSSVIGKKSAYIQNLNISNDGTQATFIISRQSDEENSNVIFQLSQSPIAGDKIECTFKPINF